MSRLPLPEVHRPGPHGITTSTLMAANISAEDVGNIAVGDSEECGCERPRRDDLTNFRQIAHGTRVARGQLQRSLP